MAVDTAIRIEGVLVKIESSYRTDPTPTGTDDSIILADDGFWGSTMTIENQAPNLRENVRSGTLMPVKPGIPNGRVVRGTLNLEVRGFDAAYSETDKPEADVLIRGSGFSAAVDTTPSSEKWTYAQEDSGFESYTVWAYGAGNVYKINGCRSVMIWPMVSGELGILRFEFIGFLDTAPATASLPSQTFGAQVPQSAVGAAFTIGSWSPDIVTAEFTTGGNLVIKPSANDSTGFSEVQFSHFDPRLTLSAKTVALSTYDPYADIKAATTRAIDWTHGGSQYNRADLAIASAYLVAEPTHEDQDDFTGWGLEYRPIDYSVIWD